MNLILKPFMARSGELPKVSASLEVDCSQLKLEFRVEDPQQNILWNESAHSAPKFNRGRDLWKETCFEFFIARTGSEIYHEFNFAPSGEWDAMSFRTFRETRDDFVSQGLSFHSTTKFQWDAKTGLMKASIRLIPAHGSRLQFLVYGQNFDFQVSTVLRLKNREQALYALAHLEDRPDFHKRELFRSYTSE